MTGDIKPMGTGIKILLKVYNLGFSLALPFLHGNKRLQTGWHQRILEDLPETCDLWMHAASGGEAYLALEILRRLDVGPVKVLITTNTAQGLEILEKGFKDMPQGSIKAQARFCPFDKPAFMARFVGILTPKLIVILETELWPGMLSAAKKGGVPVLLVNGRISPKSLKGYLRVKGLFRALAPNTVMAISDDDAARFKALFINSEVGVMPNIKFDRLQAAVQTPKTPVLAQFLTANAPFVVLGSTRQEEESQVLDIIDGLKREHPGAIIGLYPRHMERLPFWRETLQSRGLSFQQRSQLEGKLAPGNILLGDTFGELGQAYQCAAAVFVGGSLAPLGGQNFMEALAAGVVPVIGPSWKNFAWVGPGIVDAGLLRIEPDGHAVASALNEFLKSSLPKDEVKTRFSTYIAQNLGGTQMVCDKIKKLFN